jgi:hypothetical protein
VKEEVMVVEVVAVKVVMDPVVAIMDLEVMMELWRWS